MCGRYAASRSPDDLIEEFEVDEDHLRAPGEPPPNPDYNMAPTKTAPVVLERAPRPEPRGEDVEPASDVEEADGEPAVATAEAEAVAAEDAGSQDEPEPVRQLRPLVWGLVPSWAKDRGVGSRMINARAESLLDKPAYRRAATSRRCLVPADGWYEWQVSPVVTDSKGKPRKQPFYVTDADHDVLAFAGVYEFWRDREKHPDDPDAWLTTFAIITTEAEGHLRRVHDRMPFALPRDRWDAWLDPTVQDPDEVRALLEPYSVDRFEVIPVSTAVNNVRNEGARLVEPLPRDQLVGVVDPVTGEIIGGQESALF
ncbi:MAG TPA: SOS response-associated peptidase [Actinomycetales bacterium]|nr:SOS response-associated peptidase [Actinomycetales bacterium]